MIFLILLLASGVFAILMAVVSFGEIEFGDSCYWCNETGRQYNDSEFDCEECNGTGILTYRYHRPLTDGNIWSRWRWSIKAVQG